MAGVRRGRHAPCLADARTGCFGFSPRRMAPTREIVFHERKGRVPVTRCPRGARAYSRRIPVLTNDSSMKTRLRASFVLRSSQNASRRSRCSGVSRSRAMKDFFSREAEPTKGALDARATGLDLRPLHERRRELRDRGVRHFGDDLREQLGRRPVDRRSISTTARARFERLRLSMQPKDPTHGRVSDAEKFRSLLVGAALVASLQHCLT